MAMSKTVLKIMFCYEDGTPIPDKDGTGVIGTTLHGWSMEREIAQRDVDGTIESFPTGRMTIMGVQTDGDQS